MSAPGVLLPSTGLATSAVADTCVLNLWFDPNDEFPIGGQEVVVGTTPIVPDNPAQEGKTFLGWYADKNFKWRFDFSQPMYEDADIYARFVPDGDVIRLDLWFHPDDAYPVVTALMAKGDTPDYPATPDPEGLTFLGWYADPNYTTFFDFSQPLYKNTNVYARLVPDENVIGLIFWFDPYGDTPIAGQDVERGTPPVKPDDPYHEGEIFLGWFSDKEYTTLFDFTKPLYEDTNVYACFAAISPTLTSVANSANGVKLTWGAVKGVHRYAIYRKAVGESKYTRYTVTASTSYTDRNSVNGTYYYYRVMALDANGKALGDWSSARGITCVRNVTPTITGIKNTGSGVRIVWDKVPGAAKYAIYRKAAGESKYIRYTVTASTYYTDTKAVNGTYYYYRLLCLDASGKAIGDWSTARGITCSR